MTEGEARVRLHARVCGRVQGVWFRGSTEREAQRLGVAGWVRNCPDGSVEAALEGTRDDVEELVTWLRVGPRHAVVESVELRNEPVRGEQGFAVRNDP